MEYFETILLSSLVLFQKIWNSVPNDDLFVQSRLAMFPLTEFQMNQSEHKMATTPMRNDFSEFTDFI